jgi:hypothetical protein
MSLIGKILGKIAAAGSSANLQKIKDDAEVRRAAKSSARMPKVQTGIKSAVPSLPEQQDKSSGVIDQEGKPKSK